MRKYFIICSFLMAAMILIPLATMDRKIQKPVSATTSSVEDDGTISVMLSENGKVQTLEEREYVIGSLAAEMSITSQDEALKAQAVACYTYAKYMKLKENTDSLNGADISDDSSTHQGYINESQRKEKWGDNFETYEEKAEKIVDSILGKTIEYNGKPIMAVYHDLCSGQTESAKTVWGEDIAYLQSVQSVGDKLSPNFSSSVVLSSDEFEKFAKKLDKVTLKGDAEDWISKTDKTDSGYIKSITLSGTNVSGKDFRSAFGLKSCNFSVSYSGEKFSIKTTGNGHMVGMSQYGADYMARQGAGWEEILKHYYTGVVIK